MNKNNLGCGLRTWIVGVTGGILLTYGFLRYTINESIKFRERIRIETMNHPTILDYNRKDSVTIMQQTNAEYKVIYIEKSDDLKNEFSNCELTAIAAKDNKVFGVELVKHVFIKDDLTGKLLDMRNEREINLENTSGISTQGSDYRGRKVIDYQAQYEYYRNILDSLEQKLKRPYNIK